MTGEDLLQVSGVDRVPAAMRASGSLSVLPPVVLFQAAQGASGDLRLVMRQPSTGGVAVVVFRAGNPTMVFMPGDGRSLGELLLAAGAVDLQTLDSLVRDRVRGAESLERLLQERTNLPAERVQRFLDFQARARLLDVLSWQEGFFELQEYAGGGETAFSLEIPGVDALACRAAARAAALPGLLEGLPEVPGNVLVRRRRGGQRPPDQVAHDVLAALGEPLLITQLVARLLIDDDLVIDAVLKLAEKKSVVLKPRAELAPDPDPGANQDPRLELVLRETVSRLRGRPPSSPAVTLTVVVMSASPTDAVHFVARLGGDAENGGGDHAPETTGLARRVVELGDSRLCLLAIRPEALSRGALGGVLARFDALVLLRGGNDPAELQRLDHLRTIARAGAGREPVTLGVELGAGFREWTDYPGATLGLADWDGRPARWLVERVVEGLLAACGVVDEA